MWWGLPGVSCSDSDRYSFNSDGWRCQRIDIRPVPRERTTIVRAWGIWAVMASR